MSKLNFEEKPCQDDDFFGALKGRSTNLKELFGIEASRPQHNASLNYQPIKEPIAGKMTAPTTVTQPANQPWSTKVAKIASAYKDGMLTGKVGVALLHNADGAGKIIVYKTKTNVLATLTLHANNGTSQLHRQSGYLQFFDDQQRYWSLHFDNAQDDFCFVACLEEMGTTVGRENDLKPIEEPAKQYNTPQHPVNKIVDSSQDGSNSVNSSTANLNTTHSKTACISRMAKLGHQLPKLTNAHNVTTTEYSDSSDAEVLVTPMAPSHKPAILSRGAVKLHQQKTQLVAVNSNTPANTMYVAPTQVLETQFMHMLVTENRTQNTEMRMNINKLETKIEKVLDKIDNYHARGTTQQSCKEDEMLALEEKLLDLKKENRKLKLNIESCEYRTPYDGIKTVIAEHSDELRTLGVTITADMDVCKLLDISLKSVAALKKQSEEYDLMLAENAKLVQSSKLEMTNESLKLESALTTVSNLEHTIETLQAALDVTQQECNALQQKLFDMTPTPSCKYPSDEDYKTQTGATVKAIMNRLYDNLACKVEELEEDLCKEKLLAIVGKTIREETLRAMQQLAEYQQH